MERDGLKYQMTSTDQKLINNLNSIKEEYLKL